MIDGEPQPVSSETPRIRPRMRIVAALALAMAVFVATPASAAPDSGAGVTQEPIRLEQYVGVAVDREPPEEPDDPSGPDAPDRPSDEPAGEKPTSARPSASDGKPIPGTVTAPTSSGFLATTGAPILALVGLALLLLVAGIALVRRRPEART